MSAEERRGRGRPPVDATSLHVRLPPWDIGRLDAWIAAQPEPRPSRPEALRLLQRLAIDYDALIHGERNRKRARREAGRAQKAAFVLPRPELPPGAFRMLTDRIKIDCGLSLGRQAEEVGVSATHLSACRAGRERPSKTLVVALRAVAAGLPPLPEES